MDRQTDQDRGRQVRYGEGIQAPLEKGSNRDDAGERLFRDEAEKDNFNAFPRVRSSINLGF